MSFDHKIYFLLSHDITYIPMNTQVILLFDDSKSSDYNKKVKKKYARRITVPQES